jgi:periplasmic divalent cation tolerance protein
MQEPSQLALVYITAKSQEQALVIGRALVEQRLAACANVLSGLASVYRWQGELQQDSEALLIVKTRTGLVSALVEQVQNLHTYDCPCVVALPIQGGSPGFLDWVAGEVRGGPDPG